MCLALGAAASLYGQSPHPFIAAGKFSEQGGTTFNIRAFGAKCDGSTADDTAFSAAFTAAAVVSGIVFVPPSQYGCAISGALTLPQNITLAGSGSQGKSILFTGLGGNVVCSAGNNGFMHVASNDIVENLALVFSQTATPACVLNITAPTGQQITNVTVRNVYVHQPNNSIGVTLGGTNNVYFYNDIIIGGLQNVVADSTNPFNYVVTFDNSTFGYNSSTTGPMIQCGGGAGYNISINFINDTFEGGVASQAISCNGNGINVRGGYFGDATPGGTWITTGFGGSVIGAWFEQGQKDLDVSNVGGFTITGNTFNDPVSIENAVPAAIIGNHFAAPSGQCGLTLEYLVNQALINNDFAGAGYSVCANISASITEWGTNQDASTQKINTAGLKVNLGNIVPTTFASLPSCASAYEGSHAPITDSTTNTYGATITGGGTNHVLGYCDGTAWTVAAQ